jgi:hypothetical protein
MKDTVLSLIRHILTAVGGIAATYGIGVSQDTITAVVGAMVGAIGATWGAVDEYRAARAAERQQRDAALTDKLTNIGKQHNRTNLIPLLAFIGIPIGVLLFGGCKHQSQVSLNSTPMLMARTDFAAAKAAAPEWTYDVLVLVAKLEYEVQAAAWFGVEVSPAKTAEAGK